MTPAQRHKVFEASIVTDLDQAPVELLARTRAKVEQLIAAVEGNADPTASHQRTTSKHSSCSKSSNGSPPGSGAFLNSFPDGVTTACSSPPVN